MRFGLDKVVVSVQNFHGIMAHGPVSGFQVVDCGLNTAE